MRAHVHDDSDIWTPPARYTCCGHRARVAGMEPAESRTLPWWTFPFEYLWRLEARLMRRAPMHVRDGLDRRSPLMGLGDEARLRNRAYLDGDES